MNNKSNNGTKTKRYVLKFFLLVFIQITFVFNQACHAQSTKYAWFTDLHIGANNAENDLATCVSSVNARNDISFVVITGDVTDLGSDVQLRKAKSLLSKLKVPYYIIPGNHDTHWSENYGQTFLELWQDDKFAFDNNGVRHIGLNTGIPWQGYDGHFTPEDLGWLDSVVTATPANEKIFFYTHHPLDATIDNWFKAVNILSKRNIQVLLCGHGHMIKILTFNNIPSFMNRPVVSKIATTGYTIAEVTPDSLLLSEIVNDTLVRQWGSTGITQKLTVQQIDSTQFTNYNTSVRWTKDLDESVAAHITAYDNKLFAVTTSGILHCYDAAGKELWKYNIGGVVTSCPIIELGVVAVITHDGDLYTLRAETGALIQSIGIGEKITSQLVSVKTTFRDEETYGLLLGTISGKMIFYDMFSLNPIWENNSATAMIQSKPLVFGDRIIYGSWDSNLYCVDINTGTLNWKWSGDTNPLFSPSVCYPVTDGSNVFVATSDKFISKIDILLGRTVWRKKDFNARESIGISNDKKKIFVKSILNKFYTLASTDGKLVKEYDLKFGNDLSPTEPFEYNDNIIACSKNGFIYQIKNNMPAPLLFMGSARILNIILFQENTFAAINMDGKIVVFSLQ